MSNTLLPTYRRLPISFARGSGAWLWDTSDRRYLDALAGIAVCGLGHAHPAVRDAICQQAGQLLHTSNLYGIDQQQALADRLTALAKMEQVFFCNSGAEANEAAIKLARAYGHQREIALPTIIVTDGSFHGRTLATLSATGNHKVHVGFEPLVQGFVRVPYGDFEAVQSVAERHAQVVAILVEPIQGEGGIQIPPPDYLAQLRTLCDQHNWLLMLDEIQTGMGRTGYWFAHQRNEHLQPDVMTLAKALGNGVPIGACLTAGKAQGLLGPGSHGSTFGGNPLACRVASSVIDTLEQEGLIERAAKLGHSLLTGFQERLANLPGIVSIRGQGLMIGIELDRPCADLVSQALQQGLLINVTADRVIRLLPPLVMTDDQANELLTTLTKLIQVFLKTA